MNGGSLTEVLVKGKIELNLKNLFKIFYDVASGMAHVHAEKLLHCDLGKVIWKHY